jgi:5-methylcytosine-specific restriction protein A
MKMRVIKWETHGTNVPKAWETSSPRRDRLPANWKNLRDIVIERASGQCQALMRDESPCPDKGTDVDHIVAGDDHALTNLQLLCRWHHNKKSSLEGNTTRKRPTERHPPESHPGLI